MIFSRIQFCVFFPWPTQLQVYWLEQAKCPVAFIQNILCHEYFLSQHISILNGYSLFWHTLPLQLIFPFLVFDASLTSSYIEKSDLTLQSKTVSPLSYSTVCFPFTFLTHLQSHVYFDDDLVNVCLLTWS